MSEFLNFNSVVLILVLMVVIFICLFLLNIKSKKNRTIFTVVLILLLVGYLVSQGGNSNGSTITELDGVLEKGNPSLVYLYSNNWIVCLSAKFVVDELETEFKEQSHPFLRFNVRSEQGLQIFRKYEIVGTPSILILNGDGTVRYRKYGFPQKNEIMNAFASAT